MAALSQQMKGMGACRVERKREGALVWMVRIVFVLLYWVLSFAYRLADAAVLPIPVQMILGHYALCFGIISSYG
jgi:hypothetical protein